MGAGVAQYGCQAWLAALFGLTAPPSGYWVALVGDEPGDEADGTTLVGIEPPAGAGYARQLYGAGTSNWGQNGAFVSSLNDLDFGAPSADWGSVTHFVLCTDASGGDLYGWGELVTPLDIAADLPVMIPAGGMSVTMSSLLSSIAI